MARPIKIGLDYFPVDTTWDIKMRLLRARFKLEGVGLIIELFQAIYREGCALAWNEDSRLLIADEAGIPLERLDEIVGFSAEKGIFNAEALKNGYLTSHGIQARWVKACTESKRKENKIPPEIDLLQHGNEFTPEENPVNSDETQENPEFSTQSKVNKSKENKISNVVAPQAATPGTDVTILEKESSLFTKIRLAFEKPYGNLTDYKREGAAIKRIIALTAGDENAVEAMVKTFYQLKTTGSRYWQEMPFTPSRLSSSGVWDGVKAVAMKQRETTDASWVDELEAEEVAG